MVLTTLALKMYISSIILEISIEIFAPPVRCLLNNINYRLGNFASKDFTNSKAICLKLANSIPITLFSLFSLST